MRKLIRPIRKFLQANKLDQYLTKKYLDYTLVVFSIVFGFYLCWDAQNVALFSFIIWLILNPISSRFLARIALCLLFFVPLLLIIKSNQAEQFAIFAYYFLVLTVITTIIELKKKQKIEARLAGKKK